MPLFAADLGVSGLGDVGVTEYDENKSVSVGRYTGAEITELAATGIYWRSFDPDSSTVVLHWDSLLVPSANALGTTDSQLVDDVWDEVLTGAAHNVANSSGRRLRLLQESGASYGGYIWVDTVNGSAGTTAYENGTSDNPVGNMADANSLATTVGISRFKIAPGSLITFAATQANQTFEGSNWTLDLNNQSIDGSVIIGAKVSGVGTNSTGTQYFFDCEMGATTIPGDTHLVGCAIASTITIGEAGDYFANACYSAVAGGGTPTLDINSAANVTVCWRHYSGGLAVANGGPTTVISYEADGQLVINATCTTTVVYARGHMSVTDNGSGTSLSVDAVVNRTYINAEVDTALTDFTSSFGDAVLDEVVEGTHTVRQLLRVFASVLVSKMSGGGTSTLVFRDIDDTKNRVTATVDGSSNRTAITLDEA